MRVTKAATATPTALRRPSAPTRRRTPSSTRSSTRCKTPSAEISGSFTQPSAKPAATPTRATLQIEVQRDRPTWQPIADGTEDAVVEALRDLAHWLYRQLRDSYEAETSDCAVDEAIAVNEWTFTKDGKRFG